MPGYATGDYVPSHFNGSIVAASYFASLCGCVLTIELLHRRGTALGNVRSWLENFSCAVAFGVMGIWCMHFIGNRAIVMDDGNDELQLVYAPGFTTLSVFLPIIGLTLAFAAAEYPTKTALQHWLALTGTGVFAGLSVVGTISQSGMHYVGNMGIYNYNLVYNPAYLAASVIISIGDCLGVLVLFYTWRDKWINSLWKRVPCAVFLAGGVSAMHFTASVGCNYKLRSAAQPGALHQTNVQVIIASVLCGAAALLVLAGLTLTRYRVWARRQRAKKVMLLCAVFDDEGKILVTTEGIMPACEITDKYNAANFSESFDTAHSVFHWIFRVSFNWSSVAEMVPRMKLHVSKVNGEPLASRPASSASSAIYDPSTFSDYSMVFREQFCIAASNLAAALHMPLDRVGVLYDKIIETGTWTEDRRISCGSLTDDLEMNLHKPVIFGRGQALVLVSKASPDMSDKLLNAGYKFAAFQSVGRTIADSMQIPIEVVEAHYNDLLRYISNLHTLQKTGTWVGFFAPIPVCHNRGFEIAVSRFDQNQLPDAQILTSQPAHWQHQILLSMDGKKAHACRKYLSAMQSSHEWSYTERQFALAVENAFRNLSTKIPQQWWNDARFYAKALGAPYSCIITGTSPPTALYNFMVLGDAHTTTDTMEAVTKVPFSFFSARQRVVKFSRDHQILARDIHQEFGALLGRKALDDKSSSRFRLPIIRRDTKSPHKSSDVVVVCDDSITSTHDSSDSGYPHKPLDSIVVETAANMLDDWQNEDVYGGILVNSETVVRSDSTGDVTNHAHLGLGAVADASRDEQEDTFADELLHVVVSRLMPAKPGY